MSKLSKIFDMNYYSCRIRKIIQVMPGDDIGILEIVGPEADASICADEAGRLDQVHQQ
jgi:hypothetical protein